MSDDKDPRRVVERFMAAMEKLDYDTALTHVSDTIVYTNIPMGPVEGPERCAGCSSRSLRRRWRTSG